MAKLPPLVYDLTNQEHRVALPGELDASMVSISPDTCSLLAVNANDELEVKIAHDPAIGSADSIRLANCGSTGSPLKADLLKVNVGATSTAVISGTGSTGGASGVPASPLKVDVKISADADNVLTARTDGLYAAKTVIPPSSVVVADSQSVTMTGTGLATAPITSEVIVDPATNNILSKSAAGIKAAIVLAPNLDSLVKDGDGTAANPLQMDVKVSSVAGNALTKTVDGLYTAPGLNTVVSAASTTTTITGNGTTATPLAVQVKLDTSEFNMLSVTSTGLLARLPTASSATFTPTGLGTLATPLSGDVRISATAGNALTAVSDGLYVDSAAIRGNPTMAAGTNTVSLTASGNHTAVIVHCVFHYNVNNDGSQTQTRTGTVTVTKAGTAVGSATSSLVSYRAGSDGYWQAMEADGVVIKQIDTAITAGQVITATVPVTGYVKSADISITLV